MLSEEQNREQEQRDRAEDRRLADRRFREYDDPTPPPGFKWVDCKYTPGQILVRIKP